MPIDDAKTYPLTPSHVMDLQRRAARRAAVGRPGFSRLYRSDPDGNSDGATSGPMTSVSRLGAPQRLRSCFRSARPSLASFDTEWFLNLCLAARNLDDVNAIFHLIYEGIGASAGALVNIDPTRYTPIFELLIDVPDTLLEAIRARRVIDDPMAVACEQRVLGFSASDLERIIEMNDRRRETMAIYAAHGLNEGFTVPFCVPGEPRGYCSFGFTDPEDLTTDVMAIINLAGGVLFETARRVLGMWVERRRNAELTPRQVDCLAFAARGLNDGQNAWELGISTQTCTNISKLPASGMARTSASTSWSARSAQAICIGIGSRGAKSSNAEATRRRAPVPTTCLIRIEPPQRRGASRGGGRCDDCVRGSRHGGTAAPVRDDRAARCLTMMRLRRAATGGTRPHMLT